MRRVKKWERLEVVAEWSVVCGVWRARCADCSEGFLPPVLFLSLFFLPFISFLLVVSYIPSYLCA